MGGELVPNKENKTPLPRPSPKLSHQAASSAGLQEYIRINKNQFLPKFRQIISTFAEIFPKISAKK